MHTFHVGRRKIIMTVDIWYGVFGTEHYLGSLMHYAFSMSV